MYRCSSLLFIFFCSTFALLVFSAPNKVTEHIEDFGTIEINVFDPKEPGMSCPAYPIISTTNGYTGNASSNVLLTQAYCLYRTFDDSEPISFYESSEVTVQRVEYDGGISRIDRLEVETFITDPKFDIENSSHDMALIYLKKPIDGIQAFMAARNPLTAGYTCRLGLSKQTIGYFFDKYADNMGRLQHLKEDGEKLSTYLILQDLIDVENIPFAPLICKVGGQQVVQGFVTEYEIQDSPCHAEYCTETYDFTIEFTNVAYYHDWIEKMLNVTQD